MTVFVRIALAIAIASTAALQACSTPPPASPAPAGVQTIHNQPIDPAAIRPVNTPAGLYDTPPRFVSGKAPIYPIELLRNGVSGSATIEFMIDVDGKAKNFTVLKTDNKYFGDHAIIAVRQWQFEPAMKNGQPVAIRSRQTFEYQPPR